MLLNSIIITVLPTRGCYDSTNKDSLTCFCICFESIRQVSSRRSDVLNRTAHSIHSIEVLYKGSYLRRHADLRLALMRLLRPLLHPREMGQAGETIAFQLLISFDIMLSKTDSTARRETRREPLILRATPPTCTWFFWLTEAQLCTGGNANFQLIILLSGPGNWPHFVSYQLTPLSYRLRYPIIIAPLWPHRQDEAQIWKVPSLRIVSLYQSIDSELWCSAFRNHSPQLPLSDVAPLRRTSGEQSNVGDHHRMKHETLASF